MSRQTKEEALKSGIINFSIGEEAGIRIMEIAQEHLLYNYNPEQAVKTITNSLIGCPEDLALQIIKGDMVLPVDVETQEVICQDRLPEHEDIYPKLNIQYWMSNRHYDIIKFGNNLLISFEDIQHEIKKGKGKFKFQFDYESILKFVQGDNNAVLNELWDDIDIKALEFIITTAKKYIETSLKIKSTMLWINNTWGCDEYETIDEECNNMVLSVMSELKDLINLDFELNIVNDDVQKYVDAVKEIDTVISNGIEPVNIMDNYSAGWLSPEGDYYALNGEIANMLHNQIADALQEKGIVPMYENDEEKKLNIKLNPDSWLEQQGWVKIHENNVQFAGNLNNKLHPPKPIVHMTDKQIEIIGDYINNCHQCLIKVGWRREKQSIGMFTAIAMKDKVIMNKKYFDF